MEMVTGTLLLNRISPCDALAAEKSVSRVLEDQGFPRSNTDDDQQRCAPLYLTDGFQGYRRNRAVKPERDEEEEGEEGVQGLGFDDNGSNTGVMRAVFGAENGNDAMAR